MAPTNDLAVAILALVFAAIIVRQLFGRGPPIWLIFAVGAVVTVLTGTLSPAGTYSALLQAAPVVLFLFALFLFAGALERHGVLDHLARWLLGRARTPSDLPLVIFVGFAIAAAFLVNDALVLLAVPLLYGVAQRAKIDAKPLLLAVAFAVTVGSALTPMGNPQNLLISISSGLQAPVASYLRYLLLPIAASVLLGALFLRWAFAGRMGPSSPEYERLRADAPPFFPSGHWAARIVRYPVIVVFPATMILLITLDVISPTFGLAAIPIWEIALAGALLTLAISPKRVAMVQAVDTRILVLFAGLFVVVGGAVAGGVISGLDSLLPIPAAGGSSTAALPSIFATSVVAPQVVSNVPWVALQLPVLTGLGYGGSTPIAWVALGAASTLAGNVTILGAASNLILVDRAERQGIEIRLVEFMRYGLPIAALSILLTFVALWFGL